MDTKPRVAIYARVSSQEQATEGVSIDAQVAALKAYAKSQGWEVFDEYVDGGYSGGTDDRPALKRLLIDASQHRFNLVSVCKLDRFFRNIRLLLNYIHNLEQQLAEKAGKSEARHNGNKTTINPKPYKPMLRSYLQTGISSIKAKIENSEPDEHDSDMLQRYQRRLKILN